MIGAYKILCFLELNIYLKLFSVTTMKTCISECSSKTEHKSLHALAESFQKKIFNVNNGDQFNCFLSVVVASTNFRKSDSFDALEKWWRLNVGIV